MEYKTNSLIIEIYENRTSCGCGKEKCMKERSKAKALIEAVTSCRNAIIETRAILDGLGKIGVYVQGDITSHAGRMARCLAGMAGQIYGQPVADIVREYALQGSLDTPDSKGEALIALISGAAPAVIEKDNGVFKSRLFELFDLFKELDLFQDNFYGICSFCTFAEMMPNAMESIIAFAEKALEDKDEWLSYYAFEKRFGKDYELGDVSDTEGRPIPLKTYEDCWNIIFN